MNGLPGCEHVCDCPDPCTHVGGQRLMLGICLYCSPPKLFESGLFIEQGAAILLVWLASKPLVPFCLCFYPVLRL